MKWLIGSASSGNIHSLCQGREASQSAIFAKFGKKSRKYCQAIKLYPVYATSFQTCVNVFAHPCTKPSLFPSYPFLLPCKHNSKPTISPATRTKSDARAFFPGLFTAVSCSFAPSFLIVPLLPSHHHHVRRNLNSAEDGLSECCSEA